MFHVKVTKLPKLNLKRNVSMNYKDDLFFDYYFLIMGGSDTIEGK